MRGQSTAVNLNEEKTAQTPSATQDAAINAFDVFCVIVIVF